MKTKLLLSLISTILSARLIAQQQTEPFEIKLDAKPTAVSIDTESNIYLGFENGDLRKFSSDGIEKESFSLPNRSPISLIEARDNRKIFLFYYDAQEVLLLDRFNSIPTRYPVSELGAYLVIGACNAPDGSIWVLENNPQRLKKIDPLRKIVIHEVQTNLSDSIHFMRVHQNLLFIVDENGINTYDQFGNFIGTKEIEGASYLHVWKNKLLITCKKGLTILDPYNMDEFGEKRVSSPKIAIFGLDSSLAIIKERGIIFSSLLED